MTRGRVCSFQLLLGLASGVLRPEGLMTIFHCLNTETPTTWMARFLYLYPSGTGQPNSKSRHSVSTDF
jgi:hypothetical protein